MVCVCLRSCAEAQSSARLRHPFFLCPLVADRFNGAASTTNLLEELGNDAERQRRPRETRTILDSDECDCLILLGTSTRVWKVIRINVWMSPFAGWLRVSVDDFYQWRNSLYVLFPSVKLPTPEENSGPLRYGTFDSQLLPGKQESETSASFLSHTKVDRWWDVCYLFQNDCWFKSSQKKRAWPTAIAYSRSE